MLTTLSLVLVLVATVCLAQKGLPAIVKDPRFWKLNELNSKENCTVCETVECIATAARILESLDTTVDPCEDFYQFACGGWIDDQILPPHRSYLATVYDLDKHLASAKRVISREPEPSDLAAVRKAKAMYSSCLKYATRTEADDAVVDVIRDKFGEWPLTVEDWDEDDFDLTDFLIKAAFLGVHPIIQLDVSLTWSIDKYKYFHLLWLQSPEFGLPVETYTEDSIVLQVYRKKILGDAERFGIANKETAEKDMRDIVEVELNLIKFIRGESGYSKTNYTVAELQDNFGQLLDWSDYITGIASSPKVGITDITDKEVLFTYYPVYLANMTEYFSQLPARTQANYIMWRVINSLDNTLVHRIVDSMFNNVVHGTTAEPSPEETCVNYVSKTFNLVLHRLLYTDKFPPEEIITVYSMFKRIQKEFDFVLAEHDWVDETTANIIREKNAALGTSILFYESSMNNTLLNNLYQNVTVDEDNFIDNVVKEREEAFARNIRSLRKPYEETREYLPHEFVAQNAMFKNRMEFTSTIFEPPNFINGVPQSINYGAVGVIFGHEVIHAFDDSGLAFNKEGVHGEWWCGDTVAKFQERQACMIDQYNNFYYDPAKQFVDGRETLGENIADNGGMKLSYRAYKRFVAETKKAEPRLPGVDFSQDQLFFVNYAQIECNVINKQDAKYIINDVHSPSKFRVNGVFQNSKDFSSVFSCPLGSEMNPVKKCEVW